MFKIDKVGTLKKDENTEIEELEDVVFNKYDLKKLKTEHSFKKNQNDSETIFKIDKKGSFENLNEENIKTAAWEDEDDQLEFDEVFNFEKGRKPKNFAAKSKYKEYLNKKFEVLNPICSWATKKSSDLDDEDDLDIVAGDFLTKQLSLKHGEIDYKHCVAINRFDNVSGPILSVKFHPFQKVGLVSTRKKVKLFNIDEEKNEKLNEIEFQDFGICQTDFTINGNQIIISSEWKPGRFYFYDIIANEVIKIPIIRERECLEFKKFNQSPDGEYVAACGSKHRIHLMSIKTKEIVADFKINSDTSALSFSKDSTKIFSHSEEGKVYVFDLRKNNRCVHRFIDEGCIKGTSISISNNQQYICCGSNSGVANVYNYNDALSNTSPKPLKTIPNLLTSLNTVKFNHNSEMLILNSEEQENAFKIVHLPSFKIFSNIPGVHAKYGQITDCDFSPNSHYLTLGNRKGLAKLIRLTHYNKY